MADNDKLSDLISLNLQSIKELNKEIEKLRKDFEDDKKLRCILNTTNKKELINVNNKIIDVNKDITKIKETLQIDKVNDVPKQNLDIFCVDRKTNYFTEVGTTGILHICGINKFTFNKTVTNNQTLKINFYNECLTPKFNENKKYKIKVTMLDEVVTYNDAEQPFLTFQNYNINTETNTRTSCNIKYKQNKTECVIDGKDWFNTDIIFNIIISNIYIGILTFLIDVVEL